jgi:hypothetical protein
MPAPWPVFSLGAAWVADLVFKRHAEELERYLRVLARDSRPEYRRAGEEFAMAARAVQAAAVVWAERVPFAELAEPGRTEPRRLGE